MAAMADKEPPERAAEFYERSANEEDRLVATAFGQLEFARTQELLVRHMPPAPARVLDVGGGTGRYATWLADLGYEVHLVEPTPLHLAQARSRSARSLSQFRVSEGHSGELPVEDASQEVVLLFGPLYHLKHEADRLRALSEARRVLVADGLLAAAGISRFAGLLDSLRHEFVDTGFGEVGYFHDPPSIANEAERSGFVVSGVFGVEGPGSLITDLNERWVDPKQRDAIVAAARLVEQEPSLLGASHHLMLLARISGTA
jgi:ubiquinone/menaquinone biosynthesis C-methylase UbiE